MRSNSIKVNLWLKIIAVLTLLYLMFSIKAKAQIQCADSTTTISNVLICPNSDYGFVDLTVFSTTGSLTYVWSTGATTQDVFGLNAGTYTVTITDASGCIQTTSHVIEELPVDTNAFLTGTNAVCGQNNGTVKYNSLLFPETPLWTKQNGDTLPNDFPDLQSIDSLPAGTYTATLFRGEEEFGRNVCINSPAGITGSLTTAFSFIGPALTTTPITGDLVYVEDSAGNIHDICSPLTASSAAAVNGKIALIDRGTCAFTDKILRAQTAGAIAVIIVNSIPGQLPDRMGGSSAGVTIPSTMISSYDGDVIKAVLASGGTVNVSLTEKTSPELADPTICLVFQDSITIGFTGSISVQCSKTDVTCFGLNDGTATATVITNGIPPYTYQWNTNPMQTTATATGLGPGNYVATVVDSNGCTGSCTVTITQPDLLVVNLELQTNILCWGDNTGAIDISASGGTPPYTYVWSNGETTQDIGSLYDGVYTVTVTGSNTCTAMQTFNVTQNPRIVKGVQINNVNCYNGTDGHILLSVSGGVPPYTYQWSNGDTSKEADSLAAGSYTVTITDAVGCDTTCSYWILQPNLLDATVNVIDVSCNGLSDGSATVYPTGGVPFSGGSYQYQWNNGQTTQTATGLSAGTYQVIVSDSNWCVTTVVVQVNEPTPLILLTTVDDVDCNGGNDGSIQVVVNGGTAPYSFQWSNGTTTSLNSNLTAGTYTVTVNDANGCSITDSYTVLEPGPTTYTLSSVAASCNGGMDGKAMVSVTSNGGIGYTYVWNTSPVQTTSVANGLPAGNYAVVITDANGCLTVDSVDVNEPTPLLVIDTSVDPSCNGSNDGSISLAISGGTNPYTVIWSNGSTSSINSGLSSGVYTVTVTDSAGCVVMNTYTLTDPAAIDLSGTAVNDVSCFGGANGNIIGHASGGTTPYSYLWSTGDFFGNNN